MDQINGFIDINWNSRSSTLISQNVFNIVIYLKGKCINNSEWFKGIWMVALNQHWIWFFNLDVEEKKFSYESEEFDPYIYHVSISCKDL